MKELFLPLLLIISVLLFSFYNLRLCENGAASLKQKLSSLPDNASGNENEVINGAKAEWEDSIRFVFAKCSRSDHVLAVSREFVNLKAANEAGEDDSYKMAKDNLFELLDELERLQKPSFSGIFG